MKKLPLFLFLAVILAVLGWHATAAAQSCTDAVFECKANNGALLGTVSITCSMQVPFNSTLPRCLPDIPLNDMYKPLKDCRVKYPTVYTACPKQSWPSGYLYSTCMTFPGM